MLQELRGCPGNVEHSLAHAVRWQEEANQWRGDAEALAMAQSHNEVLGEISVVSLAS